MRHLRLVAVCVLMWRGAAAYGQEQLLLELSVQGDRLELYSPAEPARRWDVPFSEADLDFGRYRLGDDLEITDDTLYLHGQACPVARLSRLEVVQQNERVKVQIYDRGAGVQPLRPSNVVRSSEHVQIASGSFVRGFVLTFGHGVEVSGEVNRSVVCVGGDISVLAGGVVRGAVVALGGTVDKSEQASVYGDLYADNQRKFKPRWYEDPTQDPVSFNVAFEYNRVAGGLAWAKSELGPQKGYAPRLQAQGGYAFGSELWQYRVGLTRDAWTGPLYYLGAYRDTKDDDARTIGRDENTMFALLFGLDYRDYYFAQGVRAHAGWAFSEHRRVTLAYFNETLTPLTANQEQWSLLNGGEFPRNYETLWRTGDSSFTADFSGRLVFLKGEVQFRLPEYLDHRQGRWTFDLEWEGSSPELGSDFEYTRFGGGVERVQPTWQHQELRSRLTVQGSGGSLPATRYLYLGGIGNLRGFDHKESFGYRSWYWNTEYGWSFGSLEVFALYDAGSVVTTTSFEGAQVLHNVGLGVQIQNTLRAQLAADARFERDPLITVRFSRPF